MLHIGLNYQPAQLVFVDESSCDRRTTFRGYAWAIKGQRAIRSVFFVRGRRYVIVLSISLFESDNYKLLSAPSYISGWNLDSPHSRRIFQL